jgi:hypothetical protein
MNQVNLSTKAGKIFWASLLGYCIAFGGFYFTTQYTQSRLDFEEKQGEFLNFRDSICEQGKTCSNINYMNVDGKKHKTIVDIQNKDIKKFDEERLQRNYSEFMKKLPWYLQMQFDSMMVIKTVNGKSLKVD